MSHNFKLVHQTLVISRISFEKQLVVALAEFHFLPLVPDSTTLRLNCKQSRIFEVVVNDVYSAEYEYCDPTLQPVSDPLAAHTLDTFQNAEIEAFDSVNADKRLGELIIHLPKEVEDDVNNGRKFILSIEFALHEPAGGLHFVLPRMKDGTLLRNAMHLFSYGEHNSARMWFPCIDSYNELCTWKIEVTVEAMMVAITAGELIDTVTSSDGKEKTYVYELNVPTSACNIALAVGPFECHIDPNMNEVKHYCLPHLMPILKSTTATLHEAFEFYEEMLSVRYPYPAYKQVFVDEAYTDSHICSSITIFSTNLLHSSRIIDQNPVSRFEQALGIAHQFFGCFISRRSWYDAWLTIGISRYLTYQYLKATFGNNEYRYCVRQMLLDVCDYEQRETPIILDSSTTMSRSYFDINRPQTIPSEYVNVFTKKSCLVLRMLENRLGKELLLQVFNKMLSLAALSSSSEYSTGMWDNVMVSTKSFSKSVFTVTGKDLEVFINQWVYQSGCAYFTGKCKFNKKRNVVELELKQDSSGKGVLKYVGPLEVTIQELDGSFNHTFKIEENKTKFEITCHSKSRRQKKKKIPLMTGEEVEMDMANLDPDSPMIWLRIDPNMLILRKLNWELTDTMWQYQLKYERDVVAQCEALHALESEKDFATSATRSTLMEIVDDDHCFYKVRIMATHSLVKVANQMMWSGPPPMLHVFQKKFGSNSCSNIVRQLKFKNFQSYYLQRALPVAMANTRTTTTICPTEITHFILDLFRYSDNSRNKYSDCYYVASLVEAATNTISISTSINSLSNESKLILEEVTRLLNLEKVLPSYRNVITISCLKCVRTLQQKGHLPSTSTLFKSYAQFGMFIDVRLAALDIISGFLTEGETQKPQLDYLLDLVEKDPVPRVRHHILLALVTQHSAISSLITTQYILSISNQLWKLMNLFCGQDTKLCSEVVELYYKLFGNKNPQSLVPEEPERGRPVADVPYTSYTADDGEYNVDNPAMEATIDYMNSVDNVVPDLGESKSKLKKKKKKNKHKHKHKSEKKERDESSRHALVSASPYLASAHDYPGPSSVQLSDPSSAEDDFLDV